MSNDCGCGPMSLILSAVLPMTDLLKIAPMHCLALPSAICCSSRLKYSGIHRQPTNFCAHPTSLDEGQTRSTCRGSFLSRETEPPKLICIKDNSNNREIRQTKTIDVSKLSRFEIIATSHFQSDNELSTRRYICGVGTIESVGIGSEQ